MSDKRRQDDTTSAYRQGKEAYLAGQRSSVNPYPEGSDRCEERLRDRLDAEQMQSLM
jgi:hypothetical protein